MARLGWGLILSDDAMKMIINMTSYVEHGTF